MNAWDFAGQDLPDGGGQAVWTCARADSWRGPGDVRVGLRTSRDGPAEPVRTVAGARSTGACSRFGQHVVAATGRRSPKGRCFVLAAGSRAVTSLRLTGDVFATQDGRTPARPAPGQPHVTVRAWLATGHDLDGLDQPGPRPAPVAGPRVGGAVGAPPPTQPGRGDMIVDWGGAG
ncbi:hypothetical protein ACFXI4_24040, partial [Streptomyces sp. NPDC059224]